MPDTLLPVITPRGAEIDRNAGSPFEAVKVARDMLHTGRIAALATLDPGSGYPYNTVTNLAVLPGGAPLLFAAGLALHARNMEIDPRISLTLAPFETGDALTAPRLSFVGKAIRLAGADFEAARERYLARYPKAKLYLSLPDAILYRMDIAGVQINGGPTRNANDVRPEDLRIDLTGAENLLRDEAAEIARLNATPDLAARLAAHAGGGEGPWRVTDIDPAGLGLATHNALARLWFKAPVRSTDDLAGEIAAHA